MGKIETGTCPLCLEPGNQETLGALVVTLLTQGRRIEICPHHQKEMESFAKENSYCPSCEKDSASSLQREGKTAIFCPKHAQDPFLP